MSPNKHSESAEWAIQEIARLSGATSRTLRHYDAIGLLAPKRTAANGYRMYGPEQLVRLQRILMLKDLGLTLPDIARVLDEETDEVRALTKHAQWLASEEKRIARQRAAVHATIRALQEGQDMNAKDAFDGFDHTQYKDEVEERWGKDAYASSNARYSKMTRQEQQDMMTEGLEIAKGFARAKLGGLAADSDEVQALVQRQVAWLGHTVQPVSPQYVGNLAEMYVGDDRFRTYYDDALAAEGTSAPGTAELIRDAVQVWASR